VQEADGNRLDTFARQRRNRGLERGAIQGKLDAAIGAHALSHTEPPLSRHQLNRRRLPQIVAVVFQALAHLDDVAMSFCGEQAGSRPLVLNQRVRGHRGAMHDDLRACQHRCAIER